MEKQIEELCDVVEVVYALMDELNITREEFERIRLEKALSNGKLKKEYCLWM